MKKIIWRNKEIALVIISRKHAVAWFKGKSCRTVRLGDFSGIYISYYYGGPCKTTHDAAYVCDGTFYLSAYDYVQLCKQGNELYLEIVLGALDHNGNER